jgi:hypothetical protein
MGLYDGQQEIDTFGKSNVQSDADVFHRANEVRTLQLSISDFPEVKVDFEVVSKALPLPVSLIAVQSLPSR